MMKIPRAPLWIKLVAGCWLVGGMRAAGVALLVAFACDVAVYMAGVVREYNKNRSEGG